MGLFGNRLNITRSRHPGEQDILETMDSFF